MKSFLILFFLATLPFIGNSTIDYSAQELKEGEKDSILKGKKANSEKIFYDTASIFKKNWDVNITFSYEKSDYVASETIYLIDSIHRYAFPIERETTSGFGRRHGSYHKGIDIPLNHGDRIVAAFDGKVRYAKFNNGGFGNLIIIRHVNGLETYYAHLSKLKVKPNQIVKAGQLIGLGGSTGRSYSPHLHFEIRYNDIAFDPEHIFDTELFCLRRENVMLGTLMQKHQQIPERMIDVDFLAKGTVYDIKSGDTLSKIANRNGTTVEELCALNGLNRNSILQVGQKIRVN